VPDINCSPEAFNVLNSAWVPVRLPDGRIVKVSPREVAQSPALEVAHPRDDFSALITEVLVCLYQTLAAPATQADRVALRKPGALPDLSGFERAAHQFNLLGDGARFLQSPVPLGNEAPTSSLLFEAPGEKTRKLNKDFYVGRAAYQVVCHDCAPALLMLNQGHARVGGSGYRTALRGGSAMTVLIQGATLWETIRLNLLATDSFLRDYSLEGAPLSTLLWESPEVFTQATVPTKQLGAYASLWWMPLALRLTSRPNPAGEPCTLCGEVHAHVLGETVHKAATASKAPAGLYHPHTAWTEKKDTADFLPVMVPKAAHMLREWVSLNLGGSRPGTALAALSGLGVAAARDARLWTFGPSCDKNTFSRWHNEVVPTLVHEELTAAELRGVALSLLEDSQKVLSLLGEALQQNKPPKPSVPLKGAAVQALATLTIACREQMGVALSQVDADSGALPLSVDEVFKASIRRRAAALFDEYVQFDGSAPKGLQYALQVRAKLRKQLGLASFKPSAKSVAK